MKAEKLIKMVVLFVMVMVFSRIVYAGDGDFALISIKIEEGSGIDEWGAGLQVGYYTWDSQQSKWWFSTRQPTTERISWRDGTELTGDKWKDVNNGIHYITHNLDGGGNDDGELRYWTGKADSTGVPLSVWRIGTWSERVRHDYGKTNLDLSTEMDSASYMDIAEAELETAFYSTSFEVQGGAGAFTSSGRFAITTVEIGTGSGFDGTWGNDLVDKYYYTWDDETKNWYRTNENPATKDEYYWRSGTQLTGDNWKDFNSGAKFISHNIDGGGNDDGTIKYRSANVNVDGKAGWEGAWSKISDQIDSEEEMRIYETQLQSAYGAAKGVARRAEEVFEAGTVSQAEWFITDKTSGEKLYYREKEVGGVKTLQILEAGKWRPADKDTIQEEAQEKSARQHYFAATPPDDATGSIILNKQIAVGTKEGDTMYYKIISGKVNYYMDGKWVALGYTNVEEFARSWARGGDYKEVKITPEVGKRIPDTRWTDVRGVAQGTEGIGIIDGKIYYIKADGTIDREIKLEAGKRISNEDFEALGGVDGRIKDVTLKDGRVVKLDGKNNIRVVQSVGAPTIVAGRTAIAMIGTGADPTTRPGTGTGATGNTEAIVLDRNNNGREDSGERMNVPKEIYDEIVKAAGGDPANKAEAIGVLQDKEKVIIGSDGITVVGKGKYAWDGNKWTKLSPDGKKESERVFDKSGIRQIKITYDDDGKKPKEIEGLVEYDKKSYIRRDNIEQGESYIHEIDPATGKLKSPPIAKVPTIALKGRKVKSVEAGATSAKGKIILTDGSYLTADKAPEPVADGVRLTEFTITSKDNKKTKFTVIDNGKGSSVKVEGKTVTFTVNGETKSFSVDKPELITSEDNKITIRDEQGKQILQEITITGASTEVTTDYNKFTIDGKSVTKPTTKVTYLTDDKKTTETERLSYDAKGNVRHLSHIIAENGVKVGEYVYEVDKTTGKEKRHSALYFDKEGIPTRVVILKDGKPKDTITYDPKTDEIKYTFKEDDGTTTDYYVQNGVVYEIKDGKRVALKSDNPIAKAILEALGKSGLNARIAAYQTRRSVQNFWLFLETAARGGLGRFFSLFMEDEELEDWREQVDNFLCKTVILGGTECWSSGICGMWVDNRVGGGLVYTEGPTGMLQIAAHVEAERTTVKTPIETMYLYKITYSVRNTEDDSKKVNVEGTGEAADERKKIDTFGYNVFLSGDRETTMYNTYVMVEPGQVSSRIGGSAFVQYSSNFYNKICIRFTKPLEIAGDSVREVCNKVTEYGGPALSVESAQEMAGAGSPQEVRENQI